MPHLGLQGDLDLLYQIFLNSVKRDCVEDWRSKYGIDPKKSAFHHFKTPSSLGTKRGADFENRGSQLNLEIFFLNQPQISPDC